MAPIGETELDVRALWRALSRRAWLLALLTIAAAVITFVGLGFVIKWLFIAAVIAALIWLITFFMRGSRA